VKFFFPDSQDFVDPTFDFHLESRSATRVRQRDDLYPHEVLSAPPYDGMLVSKAVVDGHGGGAGKYTSAQRHRFMRVGVRDYFRLNETSLETMGDCGAFTYVKERRPPFTAEEVADFYGDCGFDYGLSVDHIILAYRADLDRQFPELQSAPKEWRERQELTLELADQFLNYHRKKKFRFIPVGIAQGWSPDSYSYAVTELQKLGYSYIAFGGFVPLKTQEVLACLERASKVRKPTTAFHLLGITRCENVELFASYGVTSFDSTSPLRRAFKDDKDNYYTPSTKYTAVRVPQIDANPRLLRRIQAGQVRQERARELEHKCLAALDRFDSHGGNLEETLAYLREYEELHDGVTDRSQVYRKTLVDRPWKDCPCAICKKIGIHVILFRGAERNRRRGFHNLFAFYNTLHHHLRRASSSALGMGRGH
jgi:hypothetical protein